MPKLTFYGGINEIGGNKILLETKESRIFLDFGESFTLLDEYFLPESYLTPRLRFGLRDYFEFGLIPKLEGLYSKEALSRTDVPFKKQAYDAVFVSHAHFDHWQHVRFLHPEIPICVGKRTKKILESTWTTTRSIKNYEGKKFYSFKDGKAIKLNDIKVRPMPVDHSVPDAHGFIVETPEGSVIYTGDIRKHGPRAELTEKFVEAAAESDPVAFIVEGTRVGDEKSRNLSEKSVYDGSKKALTIDKPSVVMRYPKDLDRFNTFHTIAKELGKTLVISRKAAYLLWTLRDEGMNLPNPFNAENLAIHGRELQRPAAWESPFIPGGLPSEEIRKNPGKYIFEVDFYTLNELVDTQPVGGTLVHSISEPFEEDPLSMMGADVLENWLKHFKMKYQQLHASGHASKKEMFDMVEKVGAKNVFPIHTCSPGLFKETGANVRLVKKGQAVEL